MALLVRINQMIRLSEFHCFTFFIKSLLTIYELIQIYKYKTEYSFENCLKNKNQSAGKMFFNGSIKYNLAE
jgi:hypothetical protein